MLRWRRLLRENLPSEIVRLGQSISLRYATWFRGQWVAVRRPMATTTTVSGSVQSATACVSDNHQQPLPSRQKVRSLNGPMGLAIPRPDLIGRVSPFKTLKAMLALQR